MPKIKSILVEHFPGRSRDKDKEHVIAISFTETGKNSFTDVKWLTLEQAHILKENLMDLLQNIK